VKQQISNIIKYLIGIALAVFFIVLAFKDIDANRIKELLQKANYFWILIPVVCSLIAFASRAYRWKLLVEASGHPVKFANAMYALMFGYLMNFVLPRLGEVSRCASLAKVEKAPFDKLVGTVIAERVFDVICLAICILLTAWLEFDRLYGLLNELIFSKISYRLQQLAQYPILIAGLLVFILFLFILINRKKSAIQSHKLTKGIANFFKGLIDGALSIRLLANPWSFIFHTCLIWFMYFMMAYTCFYALAETAHLSYKAGMFVLVVGGIAMSAPVQGGLGIFHQIVKQGLALYDVPADAALGYAILSHESQLVVVVVGGLIAIALLYKAGQKNKIKAE
jgi:glycosyltransferase 2 family protein